MKKCISLLLVFVMLLCYIPAGAFAADGAYYVAGTADLCGSTWACGDAANQMTLNADGLYEKTYQNVPAGDHEFKITDGTWDNSWGKDGGSANYAFTTTEVVNVVITFNAETKEITVTQITVVPYYVAGTSSLCGSNWANNDPANQMTLNADGLYEKTFQNVPAGTHEFKVTDGTWDNCWGDNGNNYVFTTTEAQDVTITFDAESKAITVTLSEATIPEEPETPEEPEVPEEKPGSKYPIVINVHYTREDGNYEGWDVYQWGGAEVTAFEVGENEAVAKIYANSNSGDIGFIVRYGGDSWTDREWVDGTTGDRTISGLSDIVTGTVDVYVDHANPAETVVELGDDVILSGDEHIDINVHYIREDGNFDGWDIFQWGGASVTPLEKVSDTEAVATITAYSNSGDIGFIVRYGGDSWTDREWVDSTTGDRTVTGLADVYCGTVDVYVYHSNPAETAVEFGTVAYGTGEAPEFDIEIQVHYYRADGDYTDWEVHMWNGVESLSATRAFEDDEVTYNGVTYAKTATYYADASDTWVGFIIKKPDWTKDPDGDRKVDLSDVTGGTVHVYAVSGSALEDFATDKSDATLGGKITAAVYDQAAETLTVTVSYPLDEEPTVDTFTLEGPDGEMTITAVTPIDEYNYDVQFEGVISEDYVYTVYFQGVPCVVTVPNLYSTEEWEAEYTYTGTDLGATWSEESTTFRVWAPTATKVDLNLYSTGDSAEDSWLYSYSMVPDVNGTWVVTVKSDLNGVYYTYSVTRKGETVEACDPYARTTGVNGNRAMVVDLDSTDPEGWENDSYVTVDNYTDAVIWELHVRDFSIDASSGVSEANRGKYLAFTEHGTTVNGEGEIATGIDYMVDLGVNYVHLLPVYDINSVDETVGGYNWGYDPKNYNVPEGSYSTDPYNGAVRVNEFKQMVMSLHEAGIGVVMDVVYNHVADAGNFCFNQIVPGYFSRVQDDGSYLSNSGCGNDTASERAMVSKYIVDSVLYWNQEYHIDGFRWDLVGLIDYDTINAVMAAVHAVNPEIIFYGEGWEMCTWTTKDGYVDKMTIQNNDKMVVSDAGVFAFFNDTIRNVIHGGVFTATDKGFVAGNVNEGTYQTIVDGYMAYSVWGSAGERVDTPLQTINYASCHDNYTLFDNLTVDAMDMTGLTAEEVKEQAADMNNLAAAYYITAQGVPFIHAGEEMLRSKPDAQQDNGFNHNSYASGDEINSIKWYTLADELVAHAHDYYQGLLAFRAAHDAMRMTEQEEILAAMSTLETDSTNVIAILNKGGNGEDAQIVSIFNAGTETAVVTLPEGEWNVYVNKDAAGTEILATVSGEVEVEATSAMILVLDEEEVPEESVPSTPIEPSKPNFGGWFEKIKEIIGGWFAPEEPEETEPVETEPVETEPVETEPEETVPSTPVEPSKPIWHKWFSWFWPFG